MKVGSSRKSEKKTLQRLTAAAAPLMLAVRLEDEVKPDLQRGSHRAGRFI